MADKYKEHFLLNTESVVEFVKDRTDVFSDICELKAKEIGDGNINYVFQVVDYITNRSVIVKQADILLRASQRPLDLHRNKIESEILRLQGELAPGFVPYVIYYDEIMCALIMEDISEYKNLRHELLIGKSFNRFSEWISEYLIKTLLPTTDIIMNPQDKKKLVGEFINPEMCEISEDLVFMQPYYNYNGRNHNVITSGNEEFVESNIFHNIELKYETALLRDIYLNNTQALIHGDLHSGSIFINSNGMKVIDPEFAFYGPAGYDVGNVIAHLLFPYIRNRYIKEAEEGYNEWIEQTISDIIDMFTSKACKIILRDANCELYKSNAFAWQYVSKIIEDSFGYAGTELIRRTIGDSKVTELTSLTDGSLKLDIERTIVHTGIFLIMNRRKISEDRELLSELFTMIDEEIVNE